MRSQFSHNARVRGLHLLAFAAGLLGLCAATAAAAQEMSGVAGTEWTHAGMLRVRDLTPFGLLRLDLRPPQRIDAPDDAWIMEFEFSYQNTLVMSGNVADYLRARDRPRAPLSPEDVAAIYELPGDAYYIDGEIGLFELIAHRKLTEQWTVYLTVPYLSYGSSLLDRAIEDFHDATGLDQQERGLVARNNFQMVYDIGGTRFAQLDQAVNGGFGDPVLGVRYSLPESLHGWEAGLEFAAKIAVGGRRPQLSTGLDDYGLQLGLQRIRGRHATYVAVSAVNYAGEAGTPAHGQVVPTMHAAYSFGLTPRTCLILQGYASRSIVQHTDLHDLSENRYALSLGVQRRTPRLLWSLALTENVSNFANTPDVVVGLGITYPG